MGLEEMQLSSRCKAPVEGCAQEKAWGALNKLWVIKYLRKNQVQVLNHVASSGQRVAPPQSGPSRD